MSSQPQNQNSIAGNEDEFQQKQSVDLIEQFLLLKIQIIERVKGTLLFNILLRMELLIGELEGKKITEDPKEYLQYLDSTPSRKGINEINKTELTPELLHNWDTFKKIFQIGDKVIHAYCIIRIANIINPEDLSKPKQSVHYTMFSWCDGTILSQDFTVKLLRQQFNIK